MTHHTFCHGLFFSQYCRKPHMMLLPENWAASICTVGRRPRQMRTKSARQHYFTNLFLGRLSLYLEQQISVCISTSCLPLGCPSFCPQLPFHQSGLGSSLCRLCSSCCCHIPAPPYCLNTSSTPPVIKRKRRAINIQHMLTKTVTGSYLYASFNSPWLFLSQ